MDHRSLVYEIAERTKYTRKEVSIILRLVAKVVREELIDGRDQAIRGLGLFVNAPFGRRIGGDPRTGERIVIPPSRRVRFKPTIRLLRAVKNSITIFQDVDLEKRYLPEGTKHGKVRSRDRSEEGRAGKDRRKDSSSRESERERAHRSRKGH